MYSEDNIYMKNKLITSSGIEDKVAKMVLTSLLNYIELCKDIEFMLEKIMSSKYRRKGYIY